MHKTYQAIKAMLERLRPHLQKDGGDIELIDITPEGIVRVRLTGHCQGCPMSAITLKALIEEEIKKIMPQAKVVNVADSLHKN